MLRIVGFIIITLLLAFLQAAAQPSMELSRNIYRVPYAGGTEVLIGRDHRNHEPPGRYDMQGFGNGGSCSVNYPIVAAAEGIIRRIVDQHNTHPPDCDPDCADFNNYVWIEHANGEWTKYTHLVSGSVSILAGLSVGDQVCAGTLLGYECEIGQASGPHLHFEVRRPNDPDNVQINVAGGGMSDARHLIPVINTIPQHWFEINDEIVASGSTSCAFADLGVAFNTTVGNNGINILMASNTIVTLAAVNYLNGSNGLYQAGGSVTLGPGFSAAAGTYFHARIGNFATTGISGGCQ